MEQHVLQKERALKRFGGDEDLYHSICGIFLKDAPQKMCRLKELIGTTEREELSLHAHSIKGNCATIGAERCRKTAFELEMAAKQGDDDKIRQLIQELEVELAAVERAINQE
jgi:HPt (histidine-containing phosphotransfer) domain-containing protein